MAKAKTTVSKSRNIVLRKRKIKKGFSLYLDIHFDGVREKEYLNLYLTGDANEDRETIELAESVKAQRIIAIRSEQHEDFDRSKSRKSFLQFFEEVVEEKQSKNFSSTLVHLKKFLGNKRPNIKDINPKWLESFKKHLLESTGSKNTASGYFERIKTALNIAVRDGYIAMNPCSRIPGIPRTKVIKEHLSIEEIKVLHNNRPVMKYDTCEAFLFACFTGLRWSDVESLQKKDITPTGITKYQKKTKEPVYIPLSTQALKYLPDLTELDNDDKVFYLPVHSQAAGEHLAKWADWSDLGKHLNFHMSRHTFAVLNLTYGNDIYTLKELLGHTDIRSTQQYAKIVNEVKKKAVANLPEF